MYTINIRIARGKFTKMAYDEYDDDDEDFGDASYMTSTADPVQPNQTPPFNPALAANVLQPFAPGLANVIRQQAGLSGETANAATGPSNVQFGKSGGRTGTKDWRVRVSLGRNTNFFYNDPAYNKDPSILYPLFNNNEGVRGVIFPFVPNISFSHTARYNNTKLTHSNYDAVFYEGSEVSSINIDGEFSVQTQNEAKYLLAAVYFFRACTKMWFGRGMRAGNPPPIVFLDGYGDHYFPHVPCVVTNFSHSIPQDVDFIATSNYSGTRMPTMSSISLSLQPVVSRKKLHNDFNLDNFAAGKLINKGFL